MKTGVLIPCYNEAVNIGSIVKSTLSYVRDVIVVDDGSIDDTTVRAKESGAVVLRHEVNKGKGEALKTGFSYIKDNTDWDAVIIMDGDGQHDPREILKFTQTAEVGYASLVIGNRMGERNRPKNMPITRWLTNKGTSCIISKIIKKKIPDTQCGYRLIRRDVLNKLELSTSRFDTESEILIKSVKKGFKIISIPIKSIYHEEISYINPVKDTIRFIKLIYAAVFRK